MNKRKIRYLRREVSLLHYIMLLTSKIFILLSVILMAGNFGLPYVYPLMIIGIIVFMPSLYFLFQKEAEEERTLENKISKSNRKRTKRKNK